MRRTTILVVEDDFALRQVIAEALESEHYAVIECSNGVDALEIATVEHPDLILLDLGLTGRSGLAVLHEVRASETTRDIPVLIVSGYALAFTRDAFSQANGAIAKPFDLYDLLRRIDGLTSERPHRLLRSAPLAGTA